MFLGGRVRVIFASMQNSQRVPGRKMKIFYLLLQWAELFQGFYTLKLVRWYSLYVADQETPRYSLCSVKETCVILAAPLCNIRFSQDARIPACWINCSFYKIRAKVIMIIFHSCCYLRYRLLISPYSWGLRDLTVQCVAVYSAWIL